MEVVLERKIALGMIRSWAAVSSSRHHVVRRIQYQMHVLPKCMYYLMTAERQESE
jgi:hypothetical protein